MKFQSKWNNYTLLVKKSYYERYPDGDRSLVPGLRAKFIGPQRIFDSEIAQRNNNWTNEQREYVENFILKNKSFGNGIYLAPGESLSDKQREVASWVPPALRFKCQHFEVINSNIEQCQTEVTAGREFCVDHDPKQPKISRGPLTTTTG